MHVPMQEEDGHLGVALSSVEVCTGVGAAAGTALGGLLFRLGGATPFGDFLFPFVVRAAPPERCCGKFGACARYRSPVWAEPTRPLTSHVPRCHRR